MRPWYLILITGCATGAALQKESETIENQLNAGREAGAYRCSPKPLAETEAQLEFVREELRQGNSVRANQHMVSARSSLKLLLKQMESCPPLVGDRDGDTVMDPDDACPDTPGLPKLAGCPDRDGDGIADGQDRCPDAPEDFDGNEDQDGCPENEDRDGDGLIDSEDHCPNDPGPVANHGCPDKDGDKVLDKDDRCPEIPGPADNGGCPYGDRDGDLILDKDDQCPDAPEDKDGFEDEDGCPEPDNDGDGIPDAADQCKNVPETVNGVDDEDGCPDTKLELVEVNRALGKIEIKQKVFFDTNKTTIKKISYRLLNEVAQAIMSSPGMEVLVEGHTDSVGSNTSNLRLSQGRAESVREYLIAQGVPAERLTAIGFGEERPLDSNRTKVGREANRRVEFTITKE